MSKKQPIRSAQLITQYGVGSSFVDRNGISYIVAGIDAWFPNDENHSGKHRRFDEEEFVVHEPRLEMRLGVSGFRTPPEFREPRWGMQIPNTSLTIPLLRFPQWHFCSRCGTMEFFPLTQTSRVFCRLCLQERNLKFELSQMQFVGLCERGHIQDFPYREWVHRAHHPQCSGNLFYTSTGEGTLAAQKIKCDCGMTRSLTDIDKANYSDTFVSFNLAKTGDVFLCQGQRPWLAETVNTECSAYLRGNQRNAKNVYFPQVVSAIGLPENLQSEVGKLQQFLIKHEVANKLPLLEPLGAKETNRLLKIFYPGLKSYSGEQLELALSSLKTNDRSTYDTDINQKVGKGGLNAANCLSSTTDATDIGEIEFRHAEFKTLREEQDSETLLTRRVQLTSDNSLLTTNFSRVLQIHRLQETRVNAGFSRIYSDSAVSLDDRKRLMRREVENSESLATDEIRQASTTDDWLPAITVFGEGIFLEINENRLNEWEKTHSSKLRRHLIPIIESSAFLGRNNQSESSAPSTDETIDARYILIHTLAHLLIKELDFESGYSASAIRERLYVSQNKSTPMSGLLIYTTDGDSAGTLGGLVRLGTPEYLEKLLARAINNARWCGSDPGCSEVGVNYGQGPGNQNLAACHSCALVSETSCEHYNKFLDRALLINLPGTSEIGFFDL
jgi:Domain of unknown function (DUF1998)